MNERQLTEFPSLGGSTSYDGPRQSALSFSSISAAGMPSQHHQKSIQQRLSATMGIPQQTREEILMLNLLGGNAQLPPLQPASTVATRENAAPNISASIMSDSAIASATSGLSESIYSFDVNGSTSRLKQHQSQQSPVGGLSTSMISGGQSPIGHAGSLRRSMEASGLRLNGSGIENGASSQQLKALANWSHQQGSDLASKLGGGQTTASDISGERALLSALNASSTETTASGSSLLSGRGIDSYIGSQKQQQTQIQQQHGLLGLIDVIRMTNDDVTTLALGCDLPSLGLNLNSSDPIYSTFMSPFADVPSVGADPVFSIPPCYAPLGSLTSLGSLATPTGSAGSQHPPSLLSTTPPAISKIASLADESLLYIFYAMPRDILQEAAAQELYDRSWRFHRELKLWVCKETNPVGSSATSESFAKGNGFERGVYIFFDPLTWSRVKKEWVLYYDQLEGRIPASKLGANHGGKGDTTMLNSDKISSITGASVNGVGTASSSSYAQLSGNSILSGSGPSGTLPFFGGNTDSAASTTSILMHALTPNISNLSIGNTSGLMNSSGTDSSASGGIGSGRQNMGIMGVGQEANGMARVGSKSELGTPLRSGINGVTNGSGAWGSFN
ncbi:transcriptional regulator [Batrachochytrium dendrobatidis]|nr:transcriptional regulator [Batrachochytrium dendrobatidis]